MVTLSKYETTNKQAPDQVTITGPVIWDLGTPRKILGQPIPPNMQPIRKKLEKEYESLSSKQLHRNFVRFADLTGLLYHRSEYIWRKH